MKKIYYMELEINRNRRRGHQRSKRRKKGDNEALILGKRKFTLWIWTLWPSTSRFALNQAGSNSGVGEFASFRETVSSDT